jgi:hypothetical protein
MGLVGSFAVGAAFGEGCDASAAVSTAAAATSSAGGDEGAVTAGKFSELVNGGGGPGEDGFVVQVSFDVGGEV